MAFKKKYFKKWYKKGYPLKKSNIFSKKSAKSQAKQIYALNKKVNKIQKLNAPEIQTVQDNIYDENFTYQLQPITNKDNATVLYKDFLLNTNKACHIDMKGDMLRPRYLNLYGMFGVINDSSLEGDWTVAQTKRLLERQPFTAYLRIIVCRLKSSTQYIPGKITQAPDQNFSADNVYDIKPIYGPLVSDVTANLDIIKNKVIKVNVNNPMKLYKIKISAKKLGYIYRKSTTGMLLDTVGQNEIAIYYQYVCPNVLRYYNTSTSTDYKVGPICRFTMSYNFGYIDED